MSHLDELNKLTLSHDFVDLAVLLTTDKLLVLIGELDLDTHLVLASRDEWNLVNNSHGSLHGIVGPIERESQIVEADLRL